MAKRQYLKGSFRSREHLINKNFPLYVFELFFGPDAAVDAASYFRNFSTVKELISGYGAETSGGDGVVRERKSAAAFLAKALTKGPETADLKIQTLARAEAWVEEALKEAYAREEELTDEVEWIEGVAMLRATEDHAQRPIPDALQPRTVVAYELRYIVVPVMRAIMDPIRFFESDVLDSNPMFFRPLRGSKPLNVALMWTLRLWGPWALTNTALRNRLATLSPHQVSRIIKFAFPKQPYREGRPRKRDYIALAAEFGQIQQAWRLENGKNYGSREAALVTMAAKYEVDASTVETWLRRRRL